MIALLTRWLAKPSKHEALMQLMREDRRYAAETQQHSAALMGKLVESVGAQSAVFQNYLLMISAANTTPQVRVMSDMDEAMMERAREAKTAVEAGALVPQDQLLGDAFEDLRAGL